MKLAASLFAVLGVSLSLPPLRPLIEQSMVWHMLVQMPLLVLAGACAAAAWPKLLGAWWAGWNRYGLTGFMVAQCVTAYWMIPALIDRAVVLPGADAAKIVSLWIAGVALREGYVRAPTTVQLFYVGYAVPMLMWLGSYLVSTDRRLCNAYSLESQLRAGWGLMALAVALGAAWTWHVWPRRSAHRPAGMLR